MSRIRARTVFKLSVPGGCFGKHQTPEGTHAHAVLHVPHGFPQLEELWRDVVRRLGGSHARIDVSALRTLPGAVCYLAKPLKIDGLDPKTLIHKSAVLKGKRSFAWFGTFRQKWAEAKRKAAEQERPQPYGSAQVYHLAP